MQREKLKRLYEHYKKEAKGYNGVLHSIILKQFAHNLYLHPSVDDIEFMWSLYKNDKTLKNVKK